MTTRKIPTKPSLEKFMDFALSRSQSFFCSLTLIGISLNFDNHFKIWDTLWIVASLILSHQGAPARQVIEEEQSRMESNGTRGQNFKSSRLITT
jgi:hypothetical protein